jgi:hypothetical protein
MNSFRVANLFVGANDWARRFKPHSVFSQLSLRLAFLPQLRRSCFEHSNEFGKEPGGFPEPSVILRASKILDASEGRFTPTGESAKIEADFMRVWSFFLTYGRPRNAPTFLSGSIRSQNILKVARKSEDANKRCRKV